MAESKEIIEFRAKKDLLEKIAKQVICENCKIVPREPPIYLSSQRFVICLQCKPKFYLQDLRPFSLLENLLPYLPTFCKYQFNGCKTIQNHRKTLVYDKKPKPSLAILMKFSCEKFEKKSSR